MTRDTGHEVGPHHELVDRTKWDMQAAIGIYGKELGKFRNVADGDTVAPHGNPLTRWNHHDM